MHANAASARRGRRKWRAWRAAARISPQCRAGPPPQLLRAVKPWSHALAPQTALTLSHVTMGAIRGPAACRGPCAGGRRGRPRRAGTQGGFCKEGGKCGQNAPARSVNRNIIGGCSYSKQEVLCIRHAVCGSCPNNTVAAKRGVRARLCNACPQQSTSPHTALAAPGGGHAAPLPPMCTAARACRPPRPRGRP